MSIESKKLLTKSPLPWQASVWSNLYQLVQKKQLPHAIFFKGIAQSGKTHFATAFAQLLLCEIPQLIPNTDHYKSCQQCHACHLFQANTHPNYHYITPADASKKEVISIEVIRDLTTALQQTAWSSDPNAHRREYSTVVIIDPADALHIAASNALLKTLEEPMTGIVFMLLSASAYIVPATIQSRCHSIILPLPSFEVAYSWMSQQVKKIPSKIDLFNLEMSLQITDNNPLHALYLLKTKRIETSYKVIFESFISLINPSVNPSDIAQIWLKQPVEIVFNSLMQITLWLMQAKLGHRALLDHLQISEAHLTAVLQYKTVIALSNYLETIKKVISEMRISHLNLLLCYEKLAYNFIYTRK